MGDPAARLSDEHGCPEWNVVIPHLGGPITGPGAPLVLIGGLPAAHLADFAECLGGPLDLIAAGAAQVLINNLPAARILVDRTLHYGCIVRPGEPMVQIGGPSFELPGNFELDGPADWQNKVLRDLYFLSTLPTGKALIDRLADSGKTITFEPAETDNVEYGNFTGGATVPYNPDTFVQTQGPDGRYTSTPPVVGLGHEMVHALGDVEGTSASGTENVPTQRNIPSEEARTIGVGSSAGSTEPTENGIRSDMGLPQRANHYGRPPPYGASPANPRPGGY